MNLEDYMRLAAGAVSATAAALPEPAATAARFVGAALLFGADLAKAGADPVAHIERLHAAEPLLDATEAAWRDELRKRFGGGDPGGDVRG